jgi:hypothetical protein
MKKTYIVMGCKRGGTSLVAGILRILGVYMGDEFIDDNHEDQEFRKKSTKEIINLIEKRNREYEIWGWKDPESIDYIHHVLPYLVNPVFILVYRDPMAIAMSESSRQEKKVGDSLFEAVNVIRRLTDFALFTDNTYVVSYEKAILNPEQYVRDMSNTLGLEYNEKAVKFINPEKGYQKI